jgi:hypothetical protein
MLTTPRAACIALIVASACNGRGEHRTKPPIANSPDAAGTVMPSQPSLTAKVTATKPGRPPLQYLTVDVTIDNPTDAARWVILPKQIPPDDGAGGGVDGLDTRGTGAALVGTFFGTGAFHAARVAAHAKVTITNLPVGWWETTPGGTMPGLHVTFADDLKIGSEPAREWFRIEPLIPDGATVDAGGAGEQAFRTEGEEAGVEIVGGVTSTVAW